MAITPEAEGRSIGGFMNKFQRQWDQQRMIDAQEEMRRQRELREESAKQRDSGGQDKPKPAKPASQAGLNTPSAAIGVGFPLERRDGAGVGGSTGRVTQYDSSKAPPYLDAIADKYGINRDAFKRMAFIESGFDPNNRNSSSGASGLFQFLPGTAKEYNLQNPFDGPANAEAAAQLWNNNKAYLSKALGRDPTAGELYLAHQQGAGGAAKLLANPNASAGSLLGERAVSLNGGQPGMRAGDFAGMWTRKFDAGGSAPAGGQTPKSVLDSTVTPSSNAIQSSSTLADVDNRLINIMNTAAQGLPAGYSVRATSGERDQSYGFHPKGLAADFQIVGPKGPIPNRGNDTTGLYTQLAKNAYAAQQQLYPDLSGKLAWGGAFATVPGGNVADLMHFDLGGERGNLHPEFRPSRLVSGDAPARTQIAADTTTRNDASPSRQQDMGGASAPATPATTTPAPATTPMQVTNTATPAATTPSAAGTPTTGNPMVTAPTPPRRSDDLSSSGNPLVTAPSGEPPRRPGELSQEFPNNRGQQPGEPPRRPFGAEQGPPMPGQPAQPAQQQPGSATRPTQQTADDPIGGFFKDIGSVFSGEPIKDQYGRTWDGFEGWVDPKAKSETANSANDSPSMLDRSSAATSATTADTSKSIFSDMPDIGSAFSPALNFFSSLFG